MLSGSVLIGDFTDMTDINDPQQAESFPGVYRLAVSFWLDQLGIF
jgi:hypothetical protein